DGLKDLPQDRIMAVVRGKEGDFYDGNLVKANVEIIKALRGWEGIDTNTRPELTFKDNGTVDVHYEVTVRGPARVGQLIVIGNKTTRQNVILRQVPLYPGQILTYPDLRIAENNLRRLNIFENDQEKGIQPKVEVLDPDGPNPYKDILVTVEETRT